jgi:hypothetical protein
MMTKCLLLTAGVLSCPMWGQTDVNRHSLTVGVGAAVPAGYSTQYLDSGIAVELNYGHRFTRFIQSDIGFESSFNKDYRNYNSKFGSGLTTTTNFFVPAGGRIVIPIWNGRIEPSFGLGGVYRYDKGNSFRSNQGGIYGVAGATYALDSQQRHRVGLTIRYMNIMSAGVPHPQWVNIFGEYTYSWGE